MGYLILLQNHQPIQPGDYQSMDAMMQLLIGIAGVLLIVLGILWKNEK